MPALAALLAGAPWYAAWAASGEGTSGNPVPSVAAHASASQAQAQAQAEIEDWVERIHRASREQSYRGSFVVWSSAGA
ncbi:hypothetical protein [Paracidovorax citrulli]|uniref:hypothetical protein n=1 Tax=Paracidovorax citrulli TaxID=80869 RepID=UPI001E6483D1|nr:hypothetical protein [Paracidovorax citrulli]